VTGLILSGSTLYGTTQSGGNSGRGTVFAIQTNGTSFTNVYRFLTGNDGANPEAGLVLSSNTLYGTTKYGGTNVQGTVFKVNTDGSGERILRSLLGSTDGANPQSGLVLLSNTLYGTALNNGPTSYGTVFKINTDGSGFQVIHSFPQINLNTGANNDGATPEAGLLLSGGNFYGTTYTGGVFGKGIIFEISPFGYFQVLANFSSTDTHGVNANGANPKAGLILSGITLYGTTYSGGSSGNGIIFSLTPGYTGLAALMNFPATVPSFDGTNTDGTVPTASLILSGGTFYGTASLGGTATDGTVFALTPAPRIPIALHISYDGNYVYLTWGDPTFTLQSSPAANGVYTNFQSGVPSYTMTPDGNAQFFRLLAQYP
jgi:uncharacterized repeat protein (TIGR03803 family)